MSDEIIEKSVAEEAATNPVQTESETKFDGMSNRDALEKAIAEKREIRPDSEAKAVAPTTTEVKAAVQADPEPPSEFSAAGKKAWVDKDITGIQKEFRRIHDARTQEISRAQTEARQAREEGKTYRELAKMAAPYIEARGQEGVTPEKAIMEALALINEFKKGEPAAVKAELKRIGIDLDKAPETGKVSIPPELEQKINTLQATQDQLLQEKKAQDFQKVVQTFDTAFGILTSQKTRTGETVFPDLLDNSETGIQFAKELGSLTLDERFQAGVLRRFPDADLTTVVREAYKYLGGRVSGEPVKVSQDNQQKHIEKSRRAAASTPGRVVSRNDSSAVMGKLSNRAALMRAYQESQEH